MVRALERYRPLLRARQYFITRTKERCMQTADLDYYIISFLNQL